MTTCIGYIGFGSLGEQVRSIFFHEATHTSELIFDDQYQGKIGEVHAFTEYSAERYSNTEFCLCLGYQQISAKQHILQELENLGRSCPPLIHYTAHKHPDSTVGAASIIYPMCNLDVDVTIGNGVILHNSVTLSHNSRIGDLSYLSPGVIVCGNVTIGRHCFIGAGTVIANGVNIADNTKVGIGSVVASDIDQPNQSVIGNPLRVLTKSLRLT